MNQLPAFPLNLICQQSETQLHLAKLLLQMGINPHLLENLEEALAFTPPDGSVVNMIVLGVHEFAKADLDDLFSVYPQIHFIVILVGYFEPEQILESEHIHPISYYVIEKHLAPLLQKLKLIE